jgi:hypothetical protein
MLSSLEIASVFECRQRFQHFPSQRSVENWVVLADSSISKDKHTLRELCYVVLMRDHPILRIMEPARGN